MTDTNDEIMEATSFYEAFVKAWMDSSAERQGLSGVAKRLRISKTRVGTIASKMRQSGVKLPNMQGVMKNTYIDANKLNKLIQDRRKPAGQ